MRRVLNGVLNAALVALALVVGSISVWQFVQAQRTPPSLTTMLRKAEGSLLAPLPVILESGVEVAVPLPGPRPTLLYFMRTTCAACVKNQPLWKALADSAEPLANILTLSGEPLEVLLEYRALGGGPVTAVATLSESASSDYHMDATPILYLLSEDGRLLASRVGVFDETTLQVFMDALRGAGSS